jgi:hypothetical protein
MMTWIICIAAIWFALNVIVFAALYFKPLRRQPRWLRHRIWELRHDL